MSNRIITISREFGSGGRTIGRAVAEKLGIPCYDAELIHKIAEESGFKEDYIREEGEDAAAGWLSSFLANRSLGPQTKISCGSFNIRLSLILQKKAPVSLLDAAQIIS